jgi:hypothetical protein
MKRFATSSSICVLMAAVFFTINCFADGTNVVSWENQEKKIVPEDGPLKDLATIVLNTGTKMTLDTKGSLRHFSYTSTFPPRAAMLLGLVSSNNEPFVVYGFDSLLPDPVYHDPSTIVMIRVSQQRGRTDIIFACVYREITEIDSLDLYLTSPSGVLEKHISDFAVYPLEGAQPGFQQETNFWSEKLDVSNKKPDEPQK